jgi:AcrR family transcriptional regulator
LAGEGRLDTVRAPAPFAMPRPNQSEERRAALLPIVADCFAEFGYRRTTTAVLAARCEVRENVLYRLWSDKKAMFLAALEHVYRSSEATWVALLDGGGGKGTPAERLLEYESRHLGEHGLHRIIFSALGETDDDEIVEALRRMYLDFQHFVRARIEEHRAEREGAGELDANLAAWAVLGLGTIGNIAREIGLLHDRKRRRLLGEAGRALLDA